MLKTSSSGKRGRIPAYIQVAAALRRRVETGAWQPNERISTLEELEVEFQVARVTIRQAVELLEREGLVTRQQGRGTFVNENVRDKRWLTLETSWAAVMSSIKNSGSRFIKVANPPLAPRLRKGEGQYAPSYAFLRSIQSKGDAPYAVASIFISQPIFEREREKFLKNTALPVLASMELSIERAQQDLIIGTADPEIAELLKVSLSAPTVEARWIVRDGNDVAIYVSEITYRADCIKLSLDFSRELSRSTSDPKESAASAASGRHSEQAANAMFDSCS
jgi:GntR family transcriptional regulator